MNDHYEQESAAAIQRYEGRPKGLASKKELTRWGRFLSYVLPFLAEKWRLAEHYAEAEVYGKQSSAYKQAQEAQEAAARADTERQQSTKVFFDLVDGLDLSDMEAARKLKLAKLLENNPGLEAQLRRIEEKADELHWRYGTTVQVVSKPAPPEPGHKPVGHLSPQQPPAR